MNEETKDLTVVAEIVVPAKQLEKAQEVAKACSAIIAKTALPIAGKNYVKVEGWQTIAMAHGCLLSAKGVQRIDGGVKALGEVIRMSDGAVLASGEGFVGDDEKTWGNRDEYAKRAMAQTRAMSRAARSAFAYTIVLMDKGYETTPAEEVPENGFDNSKTTKAQPKSKSNGKPKSGSKAKGDGFISDAQFKLLWAKTGNISYVDGENVDIATALGEIYSDTFPEEPLPDDENGKPDFRAIGWKQMDALLEAIQYHTEENG